MALIVESGKATVLYDDAVVLEGHTGPVLAADFSGDGSLIALAGMDQKVFLWKLPKHHHENPSLGAFQGHRGAIVALAWHHSTSDIVTGSTDKTVGLWDAETGLRRRKFAGHTGIVNSVACNADRAIVSASDDGLVRWWDERERDSVFRVSSDFPVLACAFNHDGQTVYAAGIDPTIRAYDTRRGETPLWTVMAEDMLVASLAVSKDDAALAVRYMDGPVRLINAREHVSEGALRINAAPYIGLAYGLEQWLGKVCFNTSGSRLYAGSESGHVVGWDVAGEKLPAVRYEGHESTVIDVKHHPQYPVVLLTSTDGLVIVRHVN